MFKHLLKALSISIVLLFGSSNTAVAGQAVSWNLYRDMMAGITKNPTGVWSFMKNDMSDHNPVNYTLLPNYNKPALWNGVISTDKSSFAWQNATSTILIGIEGKNTSSLKNIPTLHPDFYSFVIIRWKSPITGKVNISGRFSLLNESGVSGINWSIDNESTTIAQGSLNNLFEGNVFSLQNVTVKKDSSLYFIVDPQNFNPAYDATGLDLIITSQQ